MKNLKDILYSVTLTSVKGTTDVNANAIVFDSRKANENSIFVAIKGTAVDGHDFISSVIEKGCKIIVAEQEVEVSDEVTLIVTDNTQKALAIMATNFYDHPSAK